MSKIIQHPSSGALRSPIFHQVRTEESIDNRLSKARKRIDSLSRVFETLIDELGREQLPLPQIRRTRSMRRSA